MGPSNQGLKLEKKARVWGQRESPGSELSIGPGSRTVQSGAGERL